MAEESKGEQDTCRILLEDYGVINKKLEAASDTGWPDRMFLIPGGKPVYIEFKAPGEDLEPKQAYVHNTLKKLGYNVQVHNNVKEAVAAVVKAMRDAMKIKKGKS